MPKTIEAQYEVLVITVNTDATSDTIYTSNGDWTTSLSESLLAHAQLLRYDDVCTYDSKVFRFTVPARAPPSILQAPKPAISNNSEQDNGSEIKKKSKSKSQKNGPSIMETIKALRLGSRLSGIQKKEAQVVIRVRERWDIQYGNEIMDVVILYFDIVEITSVQARQKLEEIIRHRWLATIKHYAPEARIILVGRTKRSEPKSSSDSTAFQREDGTQLAQGIGAVSYLEIDREALEAPPGDAGLAELARVLAWAACRSGNSNSR